VGAFTAVAWVLPLVGGPAVLALVESTTTPASVVGWIALGVALWGGLFVVERTSALVRGVREPGFTVRPLAPAYLRFGPRRTHRVVAVVGGAVLINLFMPTFLGFKGSIPEFQAFGPWDDWLIAVDLALHGGHHPWELLHPIFARPWLTRTLDWLYYAWFYVAVFGFLLIGLKSVGTARAQFFVAFTAMWVLLGIVAATAMASVGPCFVGMLEGGTDAFQPLMGYLTALHAEMPLKSLQVQALLWESYESPTGELTTGIAAMPSLHVALPALYAVATWRRHRFWSVLLWIFTLVTLVGSVHLAWHYAVDGYFSILAVFPLWAASGACVRRLRDRRAAWGTSRVKRP
jgi:hypothetical protein